MSSTEHHTGIIKRRDDIENIDLFFEELCIKELGQARAINEFQRLYNWYKVYKYYSDNTSYIVGGDNKLYEIVEDNMNDEVECTTITDLGDGRFFFNSSFYNGGTWLNECLEDALFEEK